jgi:tRNA 2-thiouridine synthesizing protein E
LHKLITTSNPHETETSGQDIGLRQTELADQHWDRARSKALADAEGVPFSDRHWEVVVFLRQYYLEQGLPINARTTARALNKHFASKDGSSYLRRLFTDGPVTGPPPGQPPYTGICHRPLVRQQLLRQTLLREQAHARA